MSYKYCIELALGKPVEEYKTFGDYQGTWIAKVDDDKYIVGGYGSCSVCDAFEAEFSDAWDKEEIELIDRYKKFGEEYIHRYHTKEELKRSYDRNEIDSWDIEGKELRDYVRNL